MENFQIILYFGRPAAGKSEVIDYLKKTSTVERKKRFHIGHFTCLDDFNLLWKKGEEDDILEELGKQRRYTLTHHTGYAVKDDFLYKILVKELSALYMKTKYNKEDTTFIEFSRSGETGYRDSLELLDPEILKKAVIVYINVSFEESKRKNLRRYSVDEKGSILKHSVPEEIMNKYRIDDWNGLTRENPDYVEIKGIKIPCAEFKNEPEITDKPEALGKELERALTRLKNTCEKIL